jgi:hypothetical protein
VDDLADANGTYVTGIKNLSQITGYYPNASEDIDGFVLTGTDFITVDVPDSPACPLPRGRGPAESQAG